MNEGLDFSIPESETKVKKSGNKLLYIFMIIILVTVLSNMIIQLYGSGEKNLSINKGLRPQELKQLALKMEKQGLTDSSANAWMEYLSRAPVRAEEKARIWYRIGRIYQEDNRFEPALNAYYRSETYARPEDITLEIGRRTQECLESLGKFAALNYELKERVGAEVPNNEGNKDNPIVAEIGGIKVRRSDLDNRIEKLIETQLARIAPYLPAEQAKKEKERLLKQYSTDSQRRMFLDQYIVEELLYRKARESGLINDTEVKEDIMEMERALLAGKALEKEYADDIKITFTDLKSYFEANREKYVQPERLKIAHILVKNKDEAKKIREKIKKGEEFASLARTLSKEKSTALNNGVIQQWITRETGSNIPGIGNPGELLEKIFSTDEGAIVPEDVVTENGVHVVKILKKEKERKLDFDEVKERVAYDLRSSKEKDVRNRLLSDLKDKYNVVIHNSVLSEKPNNETGDQTTTSK